MLIRCIKYETASFINYLLIFLTCSFTDLLIFTADTAGVSNCAVSLNCFALCQVCQVLDLLDTNNTIDVGSTQSMTLSKDTKATNAVLTYTHTQDGYNR